MKRNDADCHSANQRPKTSTKLMGELVAQEASLRMTDKIEKVEHDLIQQADLQNVLLSSLRTLCHQFGLDKTYWLAYSGGLDSHVLLSLCCSLRSEFAINIRAIHINHGLSPNAVAWAKHCKKTCEENGIDFIEHTLSLHLETGDSLEEEARAQRYAFFADCLEEGDVLLTAHHQEDQAETVLLQLLRGAGLKGLSAMPLTKTFARGFHCRPLITFSRTLLRHYAEHQQLEWVEDESNQNTKFTRNFIRQQVMPLLKSRWPAVATTIARSAMHCAEAQALLEEHALELCAITKGIADNTLSVAKLRSFNAERQRLVLRVWIQQQRHSLPDARKIETIRQNVLTAAWDKMPCVAWGEVELRRFRDDLYLIKSLGVHDTQRTYTWDFSHPLHLSGIGYLHSSLALGLGLKAPTLPISIRFRQGGERIHVPGRGHHTLKNLFQEWGILPWERDRLPLLYIDDQLIGIVGYFIDPNYAAKPHEMGVEIWLERR